MKFTLTDHSLRKIELHAGDFSACFSAGELVAVRTPFFFYRTDDHYRQPDSTRRHLEEWRLAFGVAMNDVKNVPQERLHRILSEQIATPDRYDLFESLERAKDKIESVMDYLI